MKALILALLTAAIVTPQGDVRDTAGNKIGTVKPNPLGGFDVYSRDGTRLGRGRATPDGRTIELLKPDGERGLRTPTSKGKR